MAEIDEKNTGPTRAIPEPTLRRLPIYYQYLKKAQAEKGCRVHLLHADRKRPEYPPHPGKERP